MKKFLIVWGFLVVPLLASAQEMRLVVVAPPGRTELVLDTRQTLTRWQRLSTYLRAQREAGITVLAIALPDTDPSPPAITDSLYALAGVQRASFAGFGKTAVFALDERTDRHLRLATEMGASRLIGLGGPRDEAAALPYMEYIVVRENRTQTLQKQAADSVHGDDSFFFDTTLMDIGTDHRHMAVFQLRETPVSSFCGSRFTEIDGFPVDTALNEPLARVRQALDSLAAHPLYRFEGSWHIKDDFWGPAPFSALIHRFQLATTGADVSFFAPDHFADSLQGQITWRDLGRLLPYENRLCVVEMTGQEILGYLEYAYDRRFHRIGSRQQEVLKTRRNDDGTVQLRARPYQFDSAGGLRYSVDLRRPAGKRVTVHSFTDGRPFRGKAWYRVAMNSFRAAGGGGHLEHGASIAPGLWPRRTVFHGQADYRLLLADWLMAQEAKPVFQPVPAATNWQLLPEDVVSGARTRDDYLLQ